MVKKGMEVKKGDVLILGKVDVPAEDGTIKKTSYCKADGDIYLLYEYPIRKQLSLKYSEKEYTGNVISKYIVMRKNKKNLFPIKKIPYKTYDYISETVDVSLISILSLPINIYKNVYYEYKLLEKKYSLMEAEYILEEELDKIIESLNEKGVQIIEKNVKINTNSVQANLEGTLLLKIKCDEYVTLEEDS